MTLDELVLAPVTPLSEAAADTGYVMTVDAEGWPTVLGRPADLDTGLPPAVPLPAPMALSILCIQRCARPDGPQSVRCARP